MSVEELEERDRGRICDGCQDEDGYARAGEEGDVVFW